MEFRCNECNRNFNTEESLTQHNFMKHQSIQTNEKAKINFKKYFILTAIGLIIIFTVLTIRGYATKPGEFDDFAKCLSEKGAIVYGNDYCQYTIRQLNFFGKSQQHLNYIKCSQNQELCNSKGIQTTPTWEIDGEMYVQVQTFEALAAYSGCEL